MARKIPAEALTYYASLGPQRSYQAVAKHYGVSKRAIVTLATKERWQERVVAIEQKARQGAEKRVSETLEEMTTRHVKMLHVIAGKALEALKAMPLDSAIDAVRALAIVIKEEVVPRSPWVAKRADEAEGDRFASASHQSASHSLS